MGTPIGTREPERGSEGLLVSRQHSRVWPGKPLLHPNPLHGGQTQLSSLHANFLPNRYCLPSGSGPSASHTSLQCQHHHEARHTQREGVCLGPHGLGEDLGLPGSSAAEWTSGLSLLLSSSGPTKVKVRIAPSLSLNSPQAQIVQMAPTLGTLLVLGSPGHAPCWAVLWHGLRGTLSGLSQMLMLMPQNPRTVVPA